MLKGQDKVLQKVRERKQITTVDDSLFEQLRNLRKEISQRDKVPPYIIFPDSTLREMCERRPTDQRSMLSVKGVGQTKFNRYGESFLNLILTHIEENDG